MTETTAKASAFSFLTLLAFILLSSTLRMPMTGVGPLVGHIRADTGMGTTAAGLLNTLPLLALGLFALAAPMLGRRLGIERALCCSTALLVVGITVRSLPGGVGWLFAGTALLGIAIAVGSVLLPAFIKREFPQHVGQMTGLYVVALSLTSGLGSGLAVPLADDVFGGSWRAALASVLVLCIPALAVWFVRARQTPAVPAPPPPVSAAAPAKLWHSWLAWQATLFNGFQALNFYTLAAWLPSILFEMNGSSAAASGWMLTLIQILALAGSFIASRLLGRFRDQRVLNGAASLLALAGNMGLLLYPPGYVAWCGLLGLGLGSSFMLALAAIGLRTRDSRQTATLSAMSQSLGYLIGAAGPLLCGILRDHTPDWRAVLWLLVIVAIAQIWMAVGAGRARYVDAPAP